MPTYQYKCPQDHYYEESRSITESDREVSCEECGELMKRVYHSPAVNLIGKGFYRNGG